jgi:hypothetical protein
MMQPWVKWMIKHNLKFVLYILWLIILPVFWLVYLQQAKKDALSELYYIKNIKKEYL